MSNTNVVNEEDSESFETTHTYRNDAEVDNTQTPDRESKEIDKTEKPRNQVSSSFYYKMYIFSRELCFLLAIVLTYAAFQNKIPKISKSPTAFPFFPENCLVKDWYKGELNDAIELSSESDLSFVMYYAPWDAESQAVRHEFSIAAQHMHKYAVVVGIIDAENSSLYNVFYNLALLYLERDPFREVCFLILTDVKDTTLTEFSVYRRPELMLTLWNETLRYSNNDWRLDSLMSWINKKLHQATVWASPPGTKSHSLSSYLQPGPALILFTPRNPLRIYNDYYSTLRSVAVDYYNCNNNMIAELLNMNLKIIAFEENIEYKKLLNKCFVQQNNKNVSHSSYLVVASYSHWLNSTCRPAVCKNDNFCEDYYVELHKPVLSCNETVESNSNSKMNPGVQLLNNDPRSPENLQLLAKSELCHYFRFAHKVQPDLFIPNQDLKVLKDFKGLSCKTNKTLAIIALDSIQHHHFAEGLGIDILNKKDKSAVVILNPALETLHVMDGEFTAKNVQLFIQNFTNGLLHRTLTSTSIPRQHTHHYGHHDSCHMSQIETTCIEELNTTSFLPTVLQPNAVIVLYYSTKCAFCSGVSHVLLSTAQVLSSVKDVRFARIDGDNQGLPWEYTMHHYPSILFFPTKRKSDSRVFPQNLSITVPNLLSFILANVESNLKLRIMWTLCEQMNFNDDLQQCIRTIRIEIMTMIGKLLRIYRFSVDSHNRTELLKHLQLLRLLHFILENPEDLNMIQKHFSLLRAFDVIPKNSKRTENIL